MTDGQKSQGDDLTEHRAQGLTPAKRSHKGQGLDRTINRQPRDQRQLAIVPIKVISECDHLDTHPFLAAPKTPSVRINVANRIVVEIFAEVQP